MRLTVFLAVVVLALAGCGSKREETLQRQEQGKKVAVEKTRTERSTIAPDGTPFVEVTLATRVLEEVSQSQAAQQLTSTTTLQAPEVSTVLNLAAGSFGGAGLATTITGVVSALALAWGAHKNSQANERGKQLVVLQKDNDEGWNKAVAYAKALPPGAPTPEAQA